MSIPEGTLKDLEGALKDLDGTFKDLEAPGWARYPSYLAGPGTREASLREAPRAT